jgi:hypothetical protein
MSKVNETTVTNYKIRAFSSSNDPDFVNAIRLYNKYINVSDLTDINQVTYCLDHYRDFYKKSEFTVGGFYRNRQLIGYCQFIYLSEEKLVVIDYIVIDEKFRGVSVFYSFIEKIKEFVITRGYEIRFVVGEINLHNSLSDEVPLRVKLLVKLLKSSNFGEIKSLYLQPMLGADNYESEQRSILMLYPADQYEVVKKETFLKIVETIYFKHYERWYKLFLNDAQFFTYQKHLHDVYKRVSEKTPSGKLVQIEGDELLFGNQDSKLISNKVRYPKKILLVAGFISLLILLVIISVSLRYIAMIELKDQFYLLVTTGFIYLLILSLFSKKAADLVSRLLEKVVEKLT